MTVIAFRPRPGTGDSGGLPERSDLTGTFRSPHGRIGTVAGHLRLQRLVLVPRGAFVTGVFTGELREPDGAVVGVDSRRSTVPVDLAPEGSGLRAVVRPVRLELLGLMVDIQPFSVEPVLPFPDIRRAQRFRRRSERPGPDVAPS